LIFFFSLGAIESPGGKPGTSPIVRGTRIYTPKNTPGGSGPGHKKNFGARGRAGGRFGGNGRVVPCCGPASSLSPPPGGGPPTGRGGGGNHPPGARGGGANPRGVGKRKTLPISGPGPGEVGGGGTSDTFQKTATHDRRFLDLLFRLVRDGPTPKHTHPLGAGLFFLAKRGWMKQPPIRRQLGGPGGARGLKSPKLFPLVFNGPGLWGWGGTEWEW